MDSQDPTNSIEVSINSSINSDGASTNRVDTDNADDLPQPPQIEPPKKGTLRLVCALRFFLFSPMKWKSDGCWVSVFHVAWFIVFIAKICYLTMLTFQIGYCRETVFSSIEDGYIALHHNLLLKWDASFETLPYPPSIGKFAVYNQDDLRNRINFAVENIYNAEVTSTGYFTKFEGDHVIIHVEYFDLIHEYGLGTFKSLVTNIQQSFEPNYGLSEYRDTEGNLLYRFNISEELNLRNIPYALDRMLYLNIMFSLHSLRVSKKYNDARCQHIYGNVTFNDNNHNGQVLVGLSTLTLPIRCYKMNFTLKDSPQCRGYHGHVAKNVKYLSWITIIVDGFLFLGGIITLFITYNFMTRNYRTIYIADEHLNLPWNEYLCNVKWWHVPSVFGDVLTVIGVTWVVKTLGSDADFKQPLEEWDEHVVYIGSGCLLTWFSMLRFIKINHKFTLLFKTLKRSAVDVLFFLACVIIIFVGFLSCIFIVLGPYHVKFDSLSTTAETLFSLINGDEVFASFAFLKENESGDPERIWLFSRFIIYLYVTIFTVFALNLLIALFNSAYEVVKNSYEQQNETRTLHQDEIPNTLSYFMFKDFKEHTRDNSCRVSVDEKDSLVSCRSCKIHTHRDIDCTCGLFNTLVHAFRCNIYTLCCCHCKQHQT